MGPPIPSVLLPPQGSSLVLVVLAVSITRFTAARIGHLDGDFVLQFSDDKVLNSGKTSAVHLDSNKVQRSYAETSGRSSEIRTRAKRGMFEEYNITELMARKQTLDYLNSIKNLVQRQFIAQHLSTCPWVTLCKFSLPIDTFLEGPTCCKQCDCDIYCVTSGSCCPDYKIESADTATGESGVKVTAICRLPALMQMTTQPKSHYMIIDKCPESSPEDLQKNCSAQYKIGGLTLDDVTIVTDVYTNTAYRNRYCARCNSGSESRIRDWIVQVECDDKAEKFASGNDLINKVLSNHKSTCELFFEPELGYEADSCAPAISECNVTGLWKKYERVVELGCWQRDLLIVFDENRYRNVMCAVCNGMDKKLHLPIDGFCDNGRAEPKSTPSFSGLITFTNLEKEEQQIVDTVCQDSYMYDHNINSCRQLYCSDLHYLVNNKCVRMYERVQSLAMCASYELIPRQSTTMNTLPNVISSLEQTLLSLVDVLEIWDVTTICEVRLFIKTGLQYVKPISNEMLRSESQNWTSIRAYITVASVGLQTFFPDGIMDRLFSLTSLDVYDSVTRMYYGFQVNTADCYIDGQTKVPKQVFKFGLIEDFLSSHIVREVAFADVTDNALIIPYASSSSNCKDRSYIYPYNSFLSCPMVKVTHSEIPGIVKSNTLWIPNMNMSVEYGQFYKDYDRKSIYICADVFLSMATGGFYPMKPTMSLNVICSSVSLLVALLFL